MGKLLSEWMCKWMNDCVGGWINVSLNEWMCQWINKLGN